MPFKDLSSLVRKISLETEDVLEEYIDQGILLKRSSFDFSLSEVAGRLNEQGLEDEYRVVGRGERSMNKE